MTIRTTFGYKLASHLAGRKIAGGKEVRYMILHCKFAKGLLDVFLQPKFFIGSRIYPGLGMKSIDEEKLWFFKFGRPIYVNQMQEIINCMKILMIESETQ